MGQILNKLGSVGLCRIHKIGLKTGTKQTPVKEAGKINRALELFQVAAGGHEEEHRNREHKIHT